MLMKGQVLDKEEILRIHKDSLKVLEDVGVKIPSEKVLALLDKAGAIVDYDRQVALIGREMVEKALKSAPKEFTLGARNPEFNVNLPSPVSMLTMDGCGTNTIDFKSGKRRPGVLADLADAGRVFEEIDNGAVLWSSITPSDVPVNCNNFVSSAISMINSSKHLQDEVQRIEEVPYYVELCKAILGSEQAMIDRKIYSVCYCTVAPLCHDKDMLEATIEISKYKAPILVYPMPCCGSTGPASLYSNIVLANAEALSAFVIFQTASPGTPLIFGAALGRINVRNGIFLEGAPETALMLAGMGQIGKHYGLPTLMAGCLTDDVMPGAQAAMEKMTTALPLVLNNIDLVEGVGLLESSMTLSLEQMLIDDEIFSMCLRLREGIDIRDEKDYYQDIKEVAQGGHYLKQKTTRKAFRTSEFCKYKIADVNTYEEWLRQGEPDMLSIAHKKVEEILAAEPKNPLDANTEKVVREIMKEAEAKL